MIQKGIFFNEGECVDIRYIIWISFVFLLLTVMTSSVVADVSYNLNLGGVDPSIAAEITSSVEEAVSIYNKYGSFNKQLNIWYDPGVPTAQADYYGTIWFGGARNTRVALHEIAHTMGVGTAWEYYNWLMFEGVWRGDYARKLAIEMGGFDDGLHGDSLHIWPWGLNYADEDGFLERIKHVRIVSALRSDMIAASGGSSLMSFRKEPEHQSVLEGETAIFSVKSPAEYSYQWYKDGSLISDGGHISGAATSTLVIDNVALSDEGVYHCAATYGYEVLNTRPRHLFVNQFTGHWEFDGNGNDSIGFNNGTIIGSHRLFSRNGRSGD